MGVGLLSSQDGSFAFQDDFADGADQMLHDPNLVLIHTQQRIVVDHASQTGFAVVSQDSPVYQILLCLGQLIESGSCCLDSGTVAGVDSLDHSNNLIGSHLVSIVSGYIRIQFLDDQQLIHIDGAVFCGADIDEADVVIEVLLQGNFNSRAAVDTQSCFIRTEAQLEGQGVPTFLYLAGGGGRAVEVQLTTLDPEGNGHGDRIVVSGMGALQLHGEAAAGGHIDVQRQRAVL